MSLRIDPRRLQTLKQLAAESGMRPGDLVRQWVEERIDAARGGATASPVAAKGSGQVLSLVQALEARVAALEAATTTAPPSVEVEPVRATTDDGQQPTVVEDAGQPQPEAASADEPEQSATPRRARSNRVSAAPSGERVALHDEMIAVLRERGPLTAAELAGAVAERGRYAPPRSGKALDAAMVSQRVSNPTYRARFTRNEGRIGLAE
jgi:hypothetical protein